MKKGLKFYMQVNKRKIVFSSLLAVGAALSIILNDRWWLMTSFLVCGWYWMLTTK